MTIIKVQTQEEDIINIVTSKIESYGYVSYGSEQWLTIVMDSGNKYKIIESKNDAKTEAGIGLSTFDTINYAVG